MARTAYARLDGDMLDSAALRWRAPRRATAVTVGGVVLALLGSAAYAVGILEPPISPSPTLVATIPAGTDLGVPVLDVAARFERRTPP